MPASLEPGALGTSTSNRADPKSIPQIGAPRVRKAARGSSGHNKVYRRARSDSTPAVAVCEEKKKCCVAVLLTTFLWFQSLHKDIVYEWTDTL